jgi:hypothetical protein
MKYIFLIIILICLSTGLYYSIAEYENLSLITKAWEIPKEQISQGYSLVQMEGENLTFYQFTTANGFIGIAKQLWLIGALVIGSTAILLPFSIYTLKAFLNSDISEAREAKKQAKNSIYKSEMALIDAKNKYQQECDLKVKGAYDKQMKIVQNELSKRLVQVEQREKAITEREKIAERKISEANTALVQYREEFQALKADFEKKEKLFTKSRNNAVATMNRRKSKHKKLQCN